METFKYMCVYTIVLNINPGERVITEAFVIELFFKTMKTLLHRNDYNIRHEILNTWCIFKKKKLLKMCF